MALQRLATTSAPDPRPTPAAPPRRVLLMCPESLGPMVRLVEDSLRARGYAVRVQLGRKARRWVRRAPPGPPTLRVLCVPFIEPAEAERLRRGIDREGRGDFHIIAMDTPRTVVQRIEAIGRGSGLRRAPRPTRAVMAQPTLLEQQLVVDRQWWWSAKVAVVLLMMGAFGGAVVDETVESRIEQVAPTIAQRMIEHAMQPTPQPRREDTVLSAVAADRPAR